MVGYFDGYIGEGRDGFAGPNAVARAKLGGEVVQERLKQRGFTYPEMRVDLIGMSSLHGEQPARPEPYEVRLRIAARTDGPQRGRGGRVRGAQPAHARAGRRRRRLGPDGARRSSPCNRCCCRASWSSPEIGLEGAV